MSEPSLQSVTKLKEFFEGAIRDRKSVSLEYAGDPRSVSPHALGKREGALHVLVYQYSGPSTMGRVVPGSSQNWRCMALSKIANAVVIDDEYKTAKDGERPQTCLDVVLCETPC